MVGKYKLLVNDEIVTSSNSYDTILDKFVKEATKQKQEPLNKNECIRVRIQAEETIYLEHCIRGQEKTDNNKCLDRRNKRKYKR